MKRLTKVLFFILCFGPGFYLCNSTHAQEYKAAVIKSSDIEPYELAAEGIQNFCSLNQKSMAVYVYDLADPAAPDNIISELSNNSFDVIFTLGQKATLFAKKNFPETQIVFGLVNDWEKYNLTNGNITGVSMDISVYDQIQILMEMAPESKRIGVMYDPYYNFAKVQKMRKQIESLGLILVMEPVMDYKKVPESVRNIITKVDALFLISDPTVITRQSVEYIILRTMWSNCPVIADNVALVSAGALYALYSGYSDIGEQMGELAGRIIRGEVKGDIQPRSPEKLYLALNFKMAKKLDVWITERILEKASIIIE